MKVGDKIPIVVTKAIIDKALLEATVDTVCQKCIVAQILIEKGFTEVDVRSRWSFVTKDALRYTLRHDQGIRDITYPAMGSWPQLEGCSGELLITNISSGAAI